MLLMFQVGPLTYAEPDSQPPRYQNWNLSIQRSLTSSLVLTAAYVGSNGKQLAGAGEVPGPTRSIRDTSFWGIF
jgi:hypothetical protein